MVVRRWVMWGVLPLSVACAEPAKPPAFPSGGDARSMEEFYERYRLNEDIGFWDATWKRADGEYHWGQLEKVAEQFPESSDVYTRSNTRALVIGGIGAAGGAVVGYTLGWNLAANESEKWSTGAQVAAYSTGGGLILISVIMTFAWHNPEEDFAEAYNRALRSKLGLPPLPAGPSSRAPLWVPRPVGASEIGWVF